MAATTPDSATTQARPSAAATSRPTPRGGHPGLRLGGHLVVESLERLLPPDAINAWDMKILGYWAAPLELHLRWAFAQPGPTAVLLRARLAAGSPTP